MTCAAVHPTTGLPCVRGEARHEYHQAERRRTSTTHRGTDVWLWRSEWTICRGCDGAGCRSPECNGDHGAYDPLPGREHDPCPGCGGAGGRLT